ncbi:MAG: hypothetical protein KDA99_30655, partial [Planctomycetales bacterium]|nr:hypothetical protein [Planctomycetales bacterium]
MKNHIGLRLLQRISGVRKSRHRCQTHRSPYLGIQELEDRRMFVVGPFGDAPIMATGSGFDGVVQIASNLFSGTASGVLLSDGLHVLTAAHVVDHDNGDIGDGHVDHGVFQIKTDFLTADGSVRTIVQQISSDNIFLPSSWDGNHEHGSDIAVFRLPAVAPATAERYDIYRGDGEHGRIFDLVGFGLTGNGTDGVREDSGGQRRFGQNIFDVNTATDRLGFDFDDVTPLGYRPEDLGLPGFESMVAQGDSGGPDFIDGKIAGINSYLRPDRFAKFGAIGIATRVARFTGFVDGVGATLHDVTLNMGLQPMGQDGMDDRIDVEQVDGTLNIAVNGMPVFSDRINHISRVRIIGSSDRDSVILNES